MRRKLFAVLSAALLAATAPLLIACAGSAQDSTDTATDAALVLTDGWAKSADEGGMTGVFGTLTNTSDSDLTLIGVTSEVAGMVELHEVTAAGVMQEIADDLVIAAGEPFELAPGANHIMLMSLYENLLAGDEVTFTLTFTSDGSESSVPFTVLVKDYSGANEDYGTDGHGADDHGDGHGEHSADAHGEHDDHGSH